MNLLVPSFLALFLFAGEGDFQAQFVDGLKALLRQDLAAAKTDLEAANRMQPANPRVLVALAQTYWRLKEPGASGAAAAKAEKFGAEDPVTLRSLAILYIEEKKFAKAGDMEARCAAKDSADRAAVTRGMTDYIEAEQPKKAIDLALATQGWEARADIRNLLGKAYEADGQVLKTLPELREAAQLKPDDESYYFDLLQAMLNHYDFEVAIQFGEIGRKRFPASAQIALATGVAYYGAYQTDAAIDAFLASLALDPAAEQPYSFLARLIDNARDKLPAVTQRFVEYQEKNPGSYLGYFLHARALIAASQYPDQAEGLLRKSISLEGGYWESHYRLGLLLEKRRALAEAEKEFRRSTELNPPDPVAHYHLFRALAGQGKIKEAEAELAVQRKVSADYQTYLGEHAGVVKRIDIRMMDAAQPPQPGK